MKNSTKILSVNFLLFIMLFITDDSHAQTPVLVKDILSGSGSSNISNMTNVNGTLFFIASDGLYGAELWKSDGTETGTEMIKIIIPSLGSFYRGTLLSVNGTLLFEGDNGKLWKSDGTEAGTTQLKNISLWKFYTDRTVYFNNMLYFTGDNGAAGIELWKTDGTVDGTVLVKDINPGSNGSGPGIYRDYSIVNGFLFFPADDGIHGYELWKSDGTSAGTVMIKDINTGSGSSYAGSFTAPGGNLNGSYFFQATDGMYSDELWKSDGTTDGTVLVKKVRIYRLNGFRCFYAIPY